MESVENSGMVADRRHSLEIPVSHCPGWVTEMIQFLSVILLMPGNARLLGVGQSRTSGRKWGVAEGEK